MSGTTRTGNLWLRQVLVASAQVAATTKDPSVATQERRIAARRGKQRARIALAHPILVVSYHILTKREPFQDLGAASVDALERARVERRLVRRLERLEYTVRLQPAVAEADQVA